MKKSTAKISEESLKLRFYIKDKPSGSEILYDEVERDTGIKMDIKGRQRLRSAIVACNREWEVVKDIGYILDSVANTDRIVTHSVKKIHSQVIKTSRVCSNLKHYVPSLSDEEKKHFTLVETVTNRMLVSSEETVEKIYKREPLKIEPLIRDDI